MSENSNVQPGSYSLGTFFWNVTDPTVRFLADKSEGLISTLGLDGSILYTNAAWSAQLGYSATEALELNLLDVLHPDSHDHCKDLLEDLVSGRATVSYEATFTAKDGSPRFVQGTAVPAVVDGVVVGVVSFLKMISRDGSGVHVLQDLLGANGALLKLATQAIMETSLDALLIMDHHGRILDFNGAAESMFGHKRGDVLGRLMGDVIVPLSMREAHAKGLKRFLESREPKILRQRLRLSALRADGTEFPVELTVSQVPVNEPPVFAGAIRDVTSQVEHERELNSAFTVAKKAEAELLIERETLAERVDERTADLSAANAELSRAARSKDEFLASMSHELRTPLNTILGSTESLEEGIYGELDVKQRRPIEMIDESGRHLLSLINDILDLSKVQAGVVELELESIVPEEIAEASLRLIREAALKKRLNISTQFDHSIETVHADGRRLKQILVNLLSNAVKFTPEGGNVGLEYVADPEREAVHFVVWDSGMGISREDQQKLFAPFIQLDAGLDREFSGTGLGLALVSRMTELHGGSVSVESPGVGEGTRFTVSLPWEAPTVVRNPTEGTGAGGEPEAAIEELDPPLGGAAPLVLLAEDNEVTIEVMSAVLQAQGYRLIVARNGQEAVDRAKEESPDLILMDVQMPVMDGIEATKQIRDITELASTPIIIVTAVAMDGDRERCLATGANEYLSKPVSLKNLTATIERLIRRES